MCEPPRISARPAQGGLTRREIEILTRIASGATNKQVAEEIFISEKTVGRHLANIYTKLGVSSRTAAVSWAYANKVVDCAGRPADVSRSPYIIRTIWPTAKTHESPDEERQLRAHTVIRTSLSTGSGDSHDDHRTPQPAERETASATTGNGLFVTDGGLETELVFHDGIDLPAFAAFPLLDNPDTRARLRRYYDGYLDIARKHGAGFVIETPTWRANPDWAAQLGYSPEQLDAVNRSAVALAEEVRAAATAEGITAVVSGCVGPRGDGYDPADAMTAEEAERYHAVQIGTFADTSADQVTAITMTNAEEAIGIVRAASAAGIPAAISFTVETDGRLPTGQPLREAIEQVDAETGGRRSLLHGQLCAPDAFRGCPRSRRSMATAARRPACERVGEEPRRTRRVDRTRRG